MKYLLQAYAVVYSAQAMLKIIAIIFPKAA